eukprot:365964-Chlamydomonas_euryale.AAC.12
MASTMALSAPSSRQSVSVRRSSVVLPCMALIRSFSTAAPPERRLPSRSSSCEATQAQPGARTLTGRSLKHAHFLRPFAGFERFMVDYVCWLCLYARLTACVCDRT